MEFDVTEASVRDGATVVAPTLEWTRTRLTRGSPRKLEKSIVDMSEFVSGRIVATNLGSDLESGRRIGIRVL